MDEAIQHPDPGSLIVLTPLRATKKERELLGSDVKLTPVRRSSRTLSKLTQNVSLSLLMRGWKSDPDALTSIFFYLILRRTFWSQPCLEDYRPCWMQPNTPMLPTRSCHWLPPATPPRPSLTLQSKSMRETTTFGMPTHNTLLDRYVDGPSKSSATPKKPKVNLLLRPSESAAAEETPKKVFVVTLFLSLFHSRLYGF